MEWSFDFCWEGGGKITSDVKTLCFSTFLDMFFEKILKNKIKQCFLSESNLFLQVPPFPYKNQMTFLNLPS